MKYHLDNIVVVEGKADEAYLSSFIDAVYVKTNGYEIPSKEIEFLNNPRNNKSIIVLTDSDAAGKEIRTRLNKLLKNPINVEVNILRCNKNGKHGVAECDKEEIINALKEHMSNKITKNILTTADINELKINKDKRDELCDKLSLGICNNKTFIKRLNYLGYTKKELKKYGD